MNNSILSSRYYAMMFSYVGMTLLVLTRFACAHGKWNGYVPDASSINNRLDTHCKNNPVKCLFENASFLSKTRNYKRSPITNNVRSFCTDGDYSCEVCIRSLQIQIPLTDVELRTLAQCIADMKYEFFTKRNWPDFNVMEPNDDASSSDVDLPDMTKMKRNNDELCPDSMDKLHCFERYMSIWMHTVASQQKRNLFAPGKKRANLTPRKYGGSLFSNLRTRIDLCPPGTDRIQCYDKILSLFVSLKARSGYNRNRNRKTREEDEEIGDNERGVIRDLIEECESENDKLNCYIRHIKALSEPSETDTSELLSSSDGDKTIVQKKRVNGLCPDEMGKVHCYEHYLRSLVHTSKDKMRGSHEFIGRKAK